MSRTENSTPDGFRQNAEHAAAMLKLLANAKRLLILHAVLKEAGSVGDLAQKVRLSPSALSQHLARLRRYGIVTAEKSGQHVFYRLANPEVEAILSTVYAIYCKK